MTSTPSIAIDGFTVTRNVFQSCAITQLIEASVISTEAADSFTVRRAVERPPPLALAVLQSSRLQIAGNGSLYAKRNPRYAGVIQSASQHDEREERR